MGDPKLRIPVPKDILWDYDEPPEDLLWRLQRIADLFPLYGRDRETVMLMYAHRDQLKLDGATRVLDFNRQVVLLARHTDMGTGLAI